MNVEDAPKKPRYEWRMEDGLDHNFTQIGRLLASLGLRLYEDAEGGLTLDEAGRVRRISSAKELAPLLIDNVRISVTKNGKYHGEKPSDSILNNMLHSRSFLTNFKRVQTVVTTPVVLGDHRPSQPGFNDGGILHLGRGANVGRGLTHINRFLDVLEFQGNADRTNAVAALQTVPYRHHFPGGKPVVLVTASKSHAGKGTLIEFIRGKTAKAAVEYQDKDWPMHKALHEQLAQKTDIGVIDFDNVRTDTGRSRCIRSGFLESFITSSEIILSSTRNNPLRTDNRFVVVMNTNEGSLSIDLLNRSLPIHLNPIGDLTDRIAKAKEKLGGDIKHEWLPAHRDQIEAEVWGMIDRWVKAGKPLDHKVRHPMGPWAQTIGGILMVNGFEDFLGNYSATRVAADPIREAISILAFYSSDKSRRASDLAKIIVSQGLAKTLLPGVDPSNQASCERAVGHRLKAYVGETFPVTTPSDTITFRLTRQNKRWDGEQPHFRYGFEEVNRSPVTDEALSGLVLEQGMSDDDALEMTNSTMKGSKHEHRT